MKEIREIKGLRRFGNLAHGVGNHYVVFTKKYVYMQVRTRDGILKDEKHPISQFLSDTEIDAYIKTVITG